MLANDPCFQSAFESGPARTEMKDLVSLFEEEVGRAPNDIALLSGNDTLTYRELNERANRLARHLLDLGAAQDSLIGISIERSFELIAGILAVLKLGAAYVPIDHQYPIERIRHMLSDTAVSLVLTRSTMAPLLLNEFIQPVFLDDAGILEAYESTGLAVRIDLQARALVMYTSGTSGKPKGVVLPHIGISRLLKNANYISLECTDTVLHHSTCSFDAGTFEIWAALLNGGTLALYPQQTLDFETLAGAIARYRVTTLLLTTSVFHLIVEHKIDCLRTLKHLVVGGDVMQAKAVKRAIGRYPHLRIVNGYGPTENSVFTSCYVITNETGIGETVPIGKPIGGTNVFVLDERMQPVETGEIGELYTNGLGMADGYLNRDDLTREKFVPCPFPEAGSRMYRTGDLVFQSADGCLHFIGRTDNQVKIRGFRVEPGEIESSINSRSDVEDCVVLPETNETPEKYLVAYVKLSAAAAGVDSRDIKSFLGSKLPHYMIPANVYIVDRFPITPNGKIDRTRLRAMVNRAGAEKIEPHNAGGGCQQVALRVWREQLRAPSLQPDDSLYDHGASSLTVIVVQAELDGLLSCAVDPVELAAAQTPREWGALYERARQSDVQHVEIGKF